MALLVGAILQAQCISPASLNYAGPLTLKMAHVGESATSTSMTFTYYNEPVPQLLFPVAGGWGGGGSTKLSGSGFFATPLTRCRFSIGASAQGNFANTTTVGVFNSVDGSLTCPYPSLNASGLTFQGQDLSTLAPNPNGWPWWQDHTML